MRPLNARSKHDLRLSAAHVAAERAAERVGDGAEVDEREDRGAHGERPRADEREHEQHKRRRHVAEATAEGDLVQRGARARAEHTADAERDARRRARGGAARLPRLRDEGDAAGGEEHGEHREQREPAAEERHREQRDQRRRHAE